MKGNCVLYVRELLYYIYLNTHVRIYFDLIYSRLSEKPASIVQFKTISWRHLINLNFERLFMLNGEKLRRPFWAYAHCNNVTARFRYKQSTIFCTKWIYVGFIDIKNTCKSSRSDYKSVNDQYSIFKLKSSIITLVYAIVLIDDV